MKFESHTEKVAGTSFHKQDLSRFGLEGKKVPSRVFEGLIIPEPTNPYDENAKDISIPNVLQQSIRLISEFPLLAVYGYNAYNHYEKQESMYIHHPDPTLSTAENLLMLLRPDKQYTATEAKVLDTALILHMEHGGGNNSTFTTRVVTSSGSDTYSTIAAAMSSLKGPKHGGANIKVMEMMEDIRNHIHDYSDKDEIEHYLSKILDKETFDSYKAIGKSGTNHIP